MVEPPSGPEVDPSVPLRQEDAFDICAVQSWLRQAVDGDCMIQEVRQFPGGASNLTYLLLTSCGDLVLRRPPHGSRAASAHDMAREARVLQGLAGHFPVPPVLATDPGGEVLGSPSFLMRRVEGLILRGNLPAGLDLAPAAAGELAQRFIDLLADLHNLDPAKLGLTELDRGEGYVARQVAGWSKRYRAALTDDVPDGESVVAWLAQHEPADLSRCLIHNDWRFDNIILNPADLTQVRAVLDWEMATVGDPLMELGSALAYWVQADDDPAFAALRRQPSDLPGMPTRDQFVERYLARRGMGLDDFTFYEVFGLFRLAVIVQQIYARYRSGATSNPMFAAFGAATTVLVQRCEQVIAR